MTYEDEDGTKEECWGFNLEKEPDSLEEYLKLMINEEEKWLNEEKPGGLIAARSEGIILGYSRALRWLWMSEMQNIEMDLNN